MCDVKVLQSLTVAMIMVFTGQAVAEQTATTAHEFSFETLTVVVKVLRKETCGSGAREVVDYKTHAHMQVWRSKIDATSSSLMYRCRYMPVVGS